MRKINFLTALLLGIITTANSSWGFVLSPHFKMKLTNLEYFVPSNPNSLPTPKVSIPDGIEDNWGLGNISGIFDNTAPLAPALWTEGQDGEHLRFVYWGLDISSWTGDPGTYITQTATTTAGGLAIPYAGADLWLWDSDLPAYSPVNISGGPPARTGVSTYPTFSGSNGGKLFSIMFAPGVTGSPTVLTQGITAGTGTPPTGHGSGFFDVIPGSGPLAAILDSNTFVTPFGNRDLFFEFDFRRAGPDGQGFQLLNETPIIGEPVTAVAATPEPTSLVLLGTGLLGLIGFLKKTK